MDSNSNKYETYVPIVFYFILLLYKSFGKKYHLAKLQGLQMEFWNYLTELLSQEDLINT